MSHDPEVIYARWLAHLGRCVSCTDFAYCDAGRELLKAWTAANETSTKQAEEFDRSQADGYAEPTFI